jgi:putative hydrolase of the HAD superfamily
MGNVFISFDNDIFFKKIAANVSLSQSDIAGLVSKNFEILRSFDKGEINPAEFYSKVVRIFKSDFDYNRFFKAYNDVFDLRKKELQILKKLKENYRVILLTNTDVMRYGFIKKNFPEMLIFDAYVLSYEEGYMKPDPRIYKAALEKAEAQADECLFIDDKADNIDAAIALGINTIHFIERAELAAELPKFRLIF